jgi:hypothetical protein
VIHGDLFSTTSLCSFINLPRSLGTWLRLAESWVGRNCSGAHDPRSAVKRAFFILYFRAPSRKPKRARLKKLGSRKNATAFIIRGPSSFCWHRIDLAITVNRERQQVRRVARCRPAFPQPALPERWTRQIRNYTKEVLGTCTSDPQSDPLVVACSQLAVPRAPRPSCSRSRKRGT